MVGRECAYCQLVKRTTNKEEPFLCEQCMRSFGRSFLLDNITSLEVPNKPYKESKREVHILALLFTIALILLIVIIYMSLRKIV